MMDRLAQIGCGGVAVLAGLTAATTLSAYVAWHFSYLVRLMPKETPSEAPGGRVVLLVGSIVTSVLLAFILKEYLATAPMRRASSTSTDRAVQLARLIAFAQNEVFIASGHGDEQFWAERPLSDAVRQALGRGVRVRMLFASGFKRPPRYLIELAKSRELELRLAAGDFQPHFAVADDIVVSVEEKHSRVRPERASLHMRSRLAAHALRSEFAEWWQHGLDATTLGSVDDA